MLLLSTEILQAKTQKAPPILTIKILQAEAPQLTITHHSTSLKQKSKPKRVILFLITDPTKIDPRLGYANRSR